MPLAEAPCVELGNAPRTPSLGPSPTPSEISSASSPEPQHIRVTPLFRALAMTPPEPEQPPGQDELERRLPGYRRIVIPRELTLIELLKQSSSVSSDDEVLNIREAKLRVVAERVGLRRLHVLAPRLKSLTLDGSALSSLRDLGIGLVHLKILSVNRCGLTSLDGVWGLGSLRELFASGNRLKDLQPLAALQKLHTLNLANNSISESSPLWTLGVCGALRRLTLSGTPISEVCDYRSRVATALPMLVTLDNRPLHTDVDFNENDFDEGSSDSDKSEDEVVLSRAPKVSQRAEPEPGPSTAPEEPPVALEAADHGPEGDAGQSSEPRPRRRPATTEGAGARPLRTHVRPRPSTAHARPDHRTNKLEILNTLMDEEWRCSGSSLTSQGAVCGNLARALRRQRRSIVTEDLDQEFMGQTMQSASRALAAEIPRAPVMEDWIKFKKDTGIEIDIDFNARPKGLDPSQAIERLEQIEKETTERLKQEENEIMDVDVDDFFPLSPSATRLTPLSTISDEELRRGLEDMAPTLNSRFIYGRYDSTDQSTNLLDDNI